MNRYCHFGNLLFLATALHGQAKAQTLAQPTTGLALSANALEFAVPGYKPGRQGAPAAGVRLHDVTFEGQPIPASQLHIRQLSEGVYELTGDANRVGNCVCAERRRRWLLRPG